MANISETMREVTLVWLGHVERRTEEDIVMITWTIEVGGHRHIETEVELSYMKRHGGCRSKERMIGECGD